MVEKCKISDADAATSFVDWTQRPTDIIEFHPSSQLLWKTYAPDLEIKFIKRIMRSRFLCRFPTETIEETSWFLYCIPCAQFCSSLLQFGILSGLICAYLVPRMNSNLTNWRKRFMLPIVSMSIGNALIIREVLIGRRYSHKLIITWSLVHERMLNICWIFEFICARFVLEIYLDDTKDRFKSKKRNRDSRGNIFLLICKLFVKTIHKKSKDQCAPWQCRI